jgi:photosystem II stability/assembly factor-like uncharacterized protein
VESILIKILKSFIIALVTLLLIKETTFTQWSKDDTIPSNPYINYVCVCDSNTAWAVGQTFQGVNVIAKRISVGQWDTVSTNGIYNNQDLTSIAAIDNMNAWVTDSYGSANGGSHIYRTTNGGQSWNVQVSTGGIFGYFNDIRFSKINREFGYAWSDPPDGPGSPFKIYRTSNHGATWLEFLVPLDTHFTGVTGSMCVTDSAHTWFGLQVRSGSPVYGKIIFTTNGGQTFGVNVFNNNVASINILEYRMDNTIAVLTVGGYMNNFFKTTNGGNTWQQNYSNYIGLSSRIMSIPNSNTWYACLVLTDFHAILKSTNNAQSWVAMTLPGDVPRQMAFMDAVSSNGKVYAYAIAHGGYVYRLVDTVAPIGINNLGTEVPTVFSLAQNYPNPFNPVTTIKYSVPKQSLVKLIIYDVIGREVTTLVNEIKHPGNYNVSFDASNFASGVYFYRMEAGDFINVKKMVLIK